MVWCGVVSNHCTPLIMIPCMHLNMVMPLNMVILHNHLTISINACLDKQIEIVCKAILFFWASTKSQCRVIVKSTVYSYIHLFSFIVFVIIRSYGMVQAHIIKLLKVLLYATIIKKNPFCAVRIWLWTRFCKVHNYILFRLTSGCYLVFNAAANLFLILWINKIVLFDCYYIDIAWNIYLYPFNKQWL
jgi:hypothetical protein